VIIFAALLTFFDFLNYFFPFLICQQGNFVTFELHEHGHLVYVTRNRKNNFRRSVALTSKLI